MTPLVAAGLGGLVSFASTSLGALGGHLARGRAGSIRFSLSIDFALGLMVSASAFSLIGPAALSARAGADALSAWLVPLAVLAGAGFVALLRGRIQALDASPVGARSRQLLLASALMLHNFPEGLASGAALAGMGLGASLPILGGISLQNVPEGALMVMCLRAMGWSGPLALLGGLASGGVELLGGALAGILLGSLHGILPALLAFAGGAMVASVLLELSEGEQVMSRRVLSAQFAAGFLPLPLLQLAVL
jgi:ZIP family zinc transporter